LLAHHAVRGEVWEKAVGYCRQAGAKAFSRCAHREAMTCFEQALIALGRLRESRDTIEQTSISVRASQCVRRAGDLRSVSSI
jgi:hypothetical protein